MANAQLVQTFEEMKKMALALAFTLLTIWWVLFWGIAKLNLMLIIWYTCILSEKHWTDEGSLQKKGIWFIL